MIEKDIFVVRCLFKATCGELLSTLLKKKKGPRAIFNRVLQVILGCFNFVLLRSDWFRKLAPFSQPIKCKTKQAFAD